MVKVKNKKHIGFGGKMLFIPWTERRSNTSIIQEVKIQRLSAHVRDRTMEIFGHITNRQDILDNVTL